MSSHAVLALPRVEAPGLDQAFLRQEQWHVLPAHRLVRIENGDMASLPTDLRMAWSDRGVHICFQCVDPFPLSRDFLNTLELEDEEAVAVFLDPSGARNEYLTLFVSPYGQIAEARVENRLHHALRAEADTGWSCPGVRARCWSAPGVWSVELLIPFTGITPAIDPPTPGDRWTGNCYRLEHLPLQEISAWQPTYTDPPDLHASDCFGILEFLA